MLRRLVSSSFPSSSLCSLGSTWRFFGHQNFKVDTSCLKILNEPEMNMKKQRAMENLERTRIQQKTQGNPTFFQSFSERFNVEDKTILRFFQTPDFLEYINEKFRVLPFLLDNEKLLGFRNAINNSEDYQKHLNDWFSKSKSMRRKLSVDQPKNKVINTEKMAVLKPFLELLLLHLNTHHSAEMEISSNLSQMAVPRGFFQF